jgi:hypothetical protein
MLFMLFEVILCFYQIFHKFLKLNRHFTLKMDSNARDSYICLNSFWKSGKHYFKMAVTEHFLSESREKNFVLPFCVSCVLHKSHAIRATSIIYFRFSASLPGELVSGLHTTHETWNSLLHISHFLRFQCWSVWQSLVRAMLYKKPLWHILQLNSSWCMWE